MSNQTQVIEQEIGESFVIYQGDCVQVIKGIPDDSIGFSCYSPPFGNLYIYSDMDADMGNSADDDEFFVHYEYLIAEKFRVTMPGRLSVVHCKDLPIYKNKAGWHGVSPFSDMITAAHLRHGWMFHSRILIWKSPVTEMEKTNSHGLLHKNFATRTQVCRVGLPDYLLVFVKPDIEGVSEDVTKNPFLLTDYIGNNPPLNHELDLRQRKPDYYKGSIEEYNHSIAVWQRYASPVWFDIVQTNVLNYRVAKESEDEKHIAPLQLDVSARAIQLWSNSSDTVLSPFAGIGSEGVSTLKLGRKFVGIELKKQYYNYAVKYLKEAEAKAKEIDLFEFAGVEVEE